MIPKAFDQIEKADIQALIDNQIPEGKTLDYKRDLPGNTKDTKKEFLADIISFANAAGGDIIYGVDEQRDEDGKSTGIPENVVGLGRINADSEILRLSNIINSTIEPQIPGIRIKAIQGFQNGSVIIIRIPQSWMGPHLVRSGGGTYRIFTRDSMGKRPVDVPGLRSLFVASENLSQRIQEIRDERLGKIVAGETPVPLPDRAKVVLHIISVNHIMSGNWIDPRIVKSTLTNGLTILGGSGIPTGRMNLDGYLGYYGNHSKGKFEVIGYTQIFRDGYIEAVNIDLVESLYREKLIAISLLEQAIIRQGNEYLNIFHRLGVDPPFLLFLNLLGVKDFLIPPPSRIRYTELQSNRWRIDRDYLLLPELLIEHYPKSHEELAGILQGTFDVLWQASGYDKSLSYDEEGNWKKS